MLGWLAVVVGAVLLLVGCGGPKEGEVVAKTIVPASKHIYMQPVMTCNAKGVCTTTYIPVTRHDPECPQLTLRGKDSDEDKVCVDRKVYDAVSIGQWYREAS